MTYVGSRELRAATLTLQNGKGNFGKEGRYPIGKWVATSEYLLLYVLQSLGPRLTFLYWTVLCKEAVRSAGRKLVHQA